MPPAVLFIGKLVVAAATYIGATYGTAIFLGKLAMMATWTFIFNSVGRLLSPKISLGSLRDQGLQVNARGTAMPREIVYGQYRKSGVLYLLGTSGTKNEYMNFVVLLADHECEELGTVYFNDEVVPLDGSGNATGKYAGYATVKKHLGTYNQTVDSMLQTALGSSFWPNTAVFGGVAHLAVQLKTNSELFPQIPGIFCLIKGRKVYDNRDGTQNSTDVSTWKYSNNAALCTLDWVRGVPRRNEAGTIVRDYGMRAPDAEIDYTAANEAANVSDETVALRAGGTEPRYTINGVMLTSVRAPDGLDALKSAMAGDCVRVGTTWIIRAGAYRTPTRTLTVDELRGPIETIGLNASRKDLFNGIKGVFMNPLDWQTTDIPAYQNSTYVTRDGGEALWRDAEFHFVTSVATCQRLSKIEVERIRRGKTFVAKCQLTALDILPTDTVYVTIPALSWSSKTFVVINFEFVVEDDGDGNPYIGIDLTLKETDSSEWSWTAASDEKYLQSASTITLSGLSNPAAPTGLAATSNSTTGFVQPDGTIIPRVKLTWTQPNEQSVIDGGWIELEYKKNADSTWLIWNRVPGSVTEEYVTDVKLGVSYDFRIRSQSMYGPRSTTYNTVTGHTVAGPSLTPVAYVSPSVINISGANGDVTTVDEATVTPYGGDGTYAYLWTRVSGTGSAQSPTSRTTKFSRNGTDQTVADVWKCVVTSGGVNVDSDNVTVNYTFGTAALVALTTQNVADYKVDPTDSHAKYRLNTSGAVEVYYEGSYHSITGQWKLTGAASSDYEARVTLTTGTLTSGTTGSWLGLGTSREWTVERTSVGLKYCSFITEIRLTASPFTVLATVTIDLTAEVDT